MKITWTLAAGSEFALVRRGARADRSAYTERGDVSLPAPPVIGVTAPFLPSPTSGGGITVRE